MKFTKLTSQPLICYWLADAKHFISLSVDVVVHVYSVVYLETPVFTKQMRLHYIYLNVDCSITANNRMKVIYLCKMRMNSKKYSHRVQFVWLIFAWFGYHTSTVLISCIFLTWLHLPNLAMVELYLVSCANTSWFRIHMQR